MSLGDRGKVARIDFFKRRGARTLVKDSLRRGFLEKITLCKKKRPSFFGA